MHVQRPQTRIALAVAAAGVLLAGCGDSGTDKAGGTTRATPVVLKMANGNGETIELEPFAAAVARLSGGTLQIRFANSWRDGATSYETGVIRDVKAGKADLAWTGSRAFDSVGVTSFDALHAPLLVDSYALERTVLEGPLVQRMLGGLEPLGVVGLGVLPGPMRRLIAVAPVRGPADYRGRRIAINRSRVAALSLRALGARAVEIARGGPIDGYDGVEQQLASIDGNHYDAVATALTSNVNLWPRPLVLFANARAFARLTAAQRSALRRAAVAALPATLAVDTDGDKEAAANLCRRHVRFVAASPGDVAALRRAVRPVYDRLARDAITKAAIAQIASLREDVAGAGDEALACAAPGSQPGARGATPIDGTYRYTLTRDDLRAAGVPEDAIVPENYGRFSWTLDRGRFSYTQRNGSARERAAGTYSVNGRIVTFTVQQAAGVYPTRSGAKPGEVFTFRWSIYRDVLSFAAVRGKVSPEGITANPWRRVGDADQG